MSSKKSNFPLRCLRDITNRKIKLIIADDKQRYLDYWYKVVDPEVFEITVGYNAVEILEKFNGNPDAYDVLFSDISMHLDDEKGFLGNMKGEFAGVGLAKSLRKIGFKGDIALASTGIDDFIGQILSHLIMCFFGVDWLVPKRTLVKGNPQFIRSHLFW